VNCPSSLRTVACLQTNPTFGEVEANLADVERALAGVRADLLVLPELFSTGYSFRDRPELRSLSESYPDGPSAACLMRLSRVTGGIVVGGFAEREGEALYNAAAIFADGKALGCYRKLHLFGFERECFDPGNRPLTVVEHGGLRVGTMVCFDWIFPEVSRTLALAGADVIAHPSNLVLPGWCQRAMCIRAMENHVFTVTANRFGQEQRAPRPELTFTGSSRIADPSGNVMCDAPARGQTLLRTSIDLEQARDKEIPSGNHLILERRPSFYAGWGEQEASRSQQRPV